MQSVPTHDPANANLKALYDYSSEHVRLRYLFSLSAYHVLFCAAEAVDNTRPYPVYERGVHCPKLDTYIDHWSIWK